MSNLKENEEPDESEAVSPSRPLICYASLVDAGASLLLFLLAIGLFFLWRSYQDAPYILVFVGWFLRSAYIKASKTQEEA